MKSNRVAEFACGDFFTIVILAHDSSMWAFGAGESGQLGIGRRMTKQMVPTKIAVFDSVQGQYSDLQ
jgi:alpha-tubulin suppressor-like RCC1 family protein